MHRRDISKALFATAAGSTAVARRAEAQSCTAPCYAQTAAEISAGVTPTNYAYVPFNAWRYGADPTGVADSTAALTNWIKVINQTGVLASQSFSAAYLPGGVYAVSGALPAITISKLRIYGDGSDVSRIQVNGGSSSFTVLQIGNSMPTSTIVFNIQVEGIGLLRTSGSGEVTLMKVINTQYSHYRDLTLYDSTGTIGGVSLFYAGHENNTFENLLCLNVSPIQLGNPSGTADDGCDHTEWRGLELQSSNDSQPLITVVKNGSAATSISNNCWVGNQVWLGGTYGFYWSDPGVGSSSAVGGDLVFENIRREQTSSSSAGQSIYISSGTTDYITNVSVRDCTFGLLSAAAGGLYFSGVLWPTLQNVDLSVGGVGVTMIARSGQTQSQLLTLNTNLDPAATTLTNMEKVFGSDDVLVNSTANPQTCVYQYTDFNSQALRGMRVYEGRKWVGSRSAVAASGGSFIIPGSTISTAIVTVAASAGSGAVEGGTFVCSVETVVLVSGTANMSASILAGKISVTWSVGSNSYVVTNETTSARNILVSVEWM